MSEQVMERSFISDDMRKKARDYSMIKRDLPERREEGERKIITGRVHIDRSVFQKTAEEKQRLKTERLHEKRGTKHLSPSRLRRLREF
jgi:hypothetical protein